MPMPSRMLCLASHGMTRKFVCVGEGTVSSLWSAVCRQQLVSVCFWAICCCQLPSLWGGFVASENRFSTQNSENKFSTQN